MISEELMPILPLEVLKHFASKIYKDFELYQVFMYNFFMLNYLNILSKKSGNFNPKVFQ